MAMGRLASLEERKKRPGKFTLPTGQVIKHQLLDEAEAHCVEDGSEFANFVQLLRRDRAGGQQQIRMAYYLRKEGSDDESWHFGSQTSLTLCADDWVALFAEALKKPWFISIVGDALAKLGKEIRDTEP
jgi:hypothetical protein